TCLALTQDGRRLAGSDFSTLEIWDTTDPARPVRLREPGHVVGAVAFSPDGRRLAAGRNRSELLSLIDTESAANVWSQPRPRNGPGVLAGRAPGGGRAGDPADGSADRRAAGQPRGGSTARCGRRASVANAVPRRVGAGGGLRAGRRDAGGRCRGPRRPLVGTA